MTTTIKPAPVKKSIRVEAQPARAFETFTTGMGRWWLKSHSLSKSPQVDVVIEPRAGGRWYELGQDGSQTEWGKVLVWSPPSRVVLAWQLDGTWTYNPALITELELRFTADGANATLVELEHRNLERMGDVAEAARASLDSLGGWTGLLELYAKAV